MPFVVCQPCRKCKSRACVLVCPVAAFREDPDRMLIDPAVCIECGACVPECPFNAIRADDEVPPQWQDDIRLNAEHSRGKDPIIK